MTRRHFNAIAATLNDHKNDTSDWRDLCVAFANLCSAENANFNRDRFINACENGL